MKTRITMNPQPKWMRAPDIPAKIRSEFGEGSQEWYWEWYASGNRISFYEEGDVFAGGQRRIHPDPTKPRAEFYEQTCKWIESLYALGEERALWEGI